MVLAWKQPSFIGGADITGYFLDYREVVDGVPEKWHEANTRAVSERAYRVGRSRPRAQTRGGGVSGGRELHLRVLFGPAGVRPEGEQEVPVPGAGGQHGGRRHPVAAQ